MCCKAISFINCSWSHSRLHNLSTNIIWIWNNVPSNFLIHPWNPSRPDNNVSLQVSPFSNISRHWCLQYLHLSHDLFHFYHWFQGEVLIALLVHLAVHPNHGIVRLFVHPSHLQLIEVIVLLILMGEAQVHNDIYLQITLDVPMNTAALLTKLSLDQFK